MRIQIISGFAALLITALIFPTPSSSQTRFDVSAQIVGGLYAYNSENDQLLLEGHNLRSQYGIDAALTYYPDSNFIWSADLEYMRSNSHNLDFATTVGGGPYPVTNFGGLVYLDEFCVDAGPRYPVCGFLRLGFGPSLALIQRTTKVPYFDIYDRLDSYCLGLYGAANATFPSGKLHGTGFYYTLTLKLRYLHSAFFDARGRDLSGYSQSFITTSLAAGIGYAF